MTLNSNSRRLLAATVAIVASLAIAAGMAEARVGGGKSSGTRGERTHTAPPSTTTAPSATKPMERSTTPGAPAATPGKVAGPAGATAGAMQAAKGGIMQRSGGLMKGLLLGGLMGLAFAGIFGSGALAGLLGFIVQTALIAALVFLGFAAARALFGRRDPATATASASTASHAPAMAQPMQRAGMAAAGSMPALEISGDDFQAFERLLGDIQAAYGRGDEKALGDRATPEMLSYFMQDIDKNRREGIRNEIGDVKLLQGDLSESWREKHVEYATVAMRFSLTDCKVDTTSGRVVEGSRTEPQEATEVWTFQRPVGGRPEQWELSAIQQTA